MPINVCVRNSPQALRKTSKTGMQYFTTNLFPFRPKFTFEINS